MWGHRRKISRILLVAACVTALMLLLAPTFVRLIIRRRLQSMISAQLNATLQIGGLTYHYPYGVEVTDAALIAQQPNEKPLELLSIPRLSVKLASMPFHSGPLVIESLTIDHPAIHLIRGPTGLVGQNGLAKSETSKEEEKHPWKLSDMFRLRHFVLNGGQIIYENRKLSHTRPLVWTDLNIDLQTQPRSGSEYGFHITAADAPLATLDATGSADIDSLLLKMDNLRLAMNVDPAERESAIPPEYQRMLQSFDIRGKLDVTTRAKLNPYDLAHSTYDTVVDLQSASARIPKWQTGLDQLSAKIHLSDGGGAPSVEVAFLDAITTTAALHLGRGVLQVEPDKKHWVLNQMAGTITADDAAAPEHTHGALDFVLSGDGPLAASNLSGISASLHILPRGISLQPREMASPIGQIAETDLTFKNGILSARRFRAGYADDVWYIKQADIDLTELPKTVSIRDMDGAITFGATPGVYPKPIEDLVASLDPSGPWFFSGTAHVVLKNGKKTDYHIQVHTARGGLKLTDRRVPIYDIKTEMNLTPSGIDIQHFDAGALRGQLNLAGTIGLAGATKYQLAAQIHGANLGDLSHFLARPGEKPYPLGGWGNLSLRLEGTLPKGDHSPLDSVSGDGTLEIKDGDFWQIPVMKSLADNSNVRSIMTVGEAAAVFTVDHGAVNLKHVAVSAPALGIDGHGQVDFNGGLNLDCITTVLGNWGEKFAAGEDVSRAVNQIQRTLNGVTQSAVMNIHVSGSINQPEIKPIPAPFLSGPVAGFTNFLKGNTQGSGGLLGYVKDNPSSASQK